VAEKKKKINYSEAWAEARALIWQYRHRLLLGGILMIFNRLVGLIFPASSKYVIDEVIVKQRHDLLLTLALAGGAATIVQAITSFALSQVLGVAAQRAITEMRKQVMEQVMRLPIRYFDSMKSGKLIARVLNDAEGIRNLVGTGVVQLVGGVVSAFIALGVLFYLFNRVSGHMAIINNGSVTGLFGSKELLDYSTTKGAIHAFTKALSSNLVKQGIRVNAVAPGPVWTPLNPADRSAEDVAKFGQKNPMGRPAQPEEISPAFVFLASPVCSSYITGIVLPVMGGPTG